MVGSIRGSARPPQVSSMAALRFRAALALLVVTSACADANEATEESMPEAPEASPPTAYVETGDVEAIRRRGRIRLANVARAHVEELPRLRWGSPHEAELAREFADRLNLELEIDEYPTEEAARQALLAGRVDVIVGRSGEGGHGPPQGIAYSVAFNRIPGVFVSRSGAAPTSFDDLADRTVTFGRSASLLRLAEQIHVRQPAVRIDTIDVRSAEEGIDMILDGSVDVTLAERWIADVVSDVHPELELGFEFGEVVYTAAVRASNPNLLRIINDFAFQVLPVGGDGAEVFGDLAEIRDRRVLRVLTVNGPSSYSVYKGDLVGFDLDLVRMFADEQDLILQMVVVPSTELLEDWLTRGLGDMIGAGVIPTAIVNSTSVVATRVYHDVDPVIIARTDLGLESAEHLGGRTVVVARNNPYLGAIERVAEARGFSLQVTPDAESTSQLLQRLESGVADITVLESHLADAELPDHPSLEVIQRVEDTPGRSWAVRADQPALLDSLNAFIGREVGGLTHAVLIRKHFRRDTRRVEQPEIRDDGSLSPWDELTRRHASAVEIDWRLLTAQMFQESRFDPRARSHVGAYGLMQMMPATAKQMGVSDLEDPEEQIRAGAAYMQWLYGRFPTHLTLADRVAFTLAAYNAGYGHVSDARRVAEASGRDPDRWFEHVELSMLSLSDPDVYRSTRHGFVRGKEPVNYVRRINELGQMYYRLAPAN